MVTLYRFRIDLSDVDRGIYESLDFRLAQHPSESSDYLLSRAFAFALSWREGLEFSAKGLADPDSPAIHARSMGGSTELWIEIGNPSARKLHKAAKASDQVQVYTYKDPQQIVQEARTEKVHRGDEIEVFSFSPAFLRNLAGCLEKDNRLVLMRNEGSLTVTWGDHTEESELGRLMLGTDI